MIVKINKIKNYGIFRNFSWQPYIPEFKRYNLIYAWNYSGKTTLSRIFRSFETGKNHVDYSMGEFELVDQIGTSHSNEEIDNNLKNIRVFNVDFINENLKWHQSPESIEPIFIIGEKNITLQEKLDEERKRLNIKEKENEDLIKSNDKIVNELNKTLREKAQHIKHFLQIPNYTIKNLKPKLEKILNNCSDYILSDDEFKINLAIYQNRSKMDHVNVETLPNLMIKDLYIKCRDIMFKRIIAETITKLKENEELNDWVRKGVELHKDETNCQFCNQPLPIDLLNRLEKHFSDDYEKLQSDILNLETLIRNHIEDLKNFEQKLPLKEQFYTEFRNEVEKFIKDMRQEIENYIKYLEDLYVAIENKRKKPFDDLAFTEVAISANDVDDSFNIVSKIKDKYQHLTSIATNHNKKTDDFENERKNAGEKLELHFIGDFIKKEDYIKKNKITLDNKNLIDSNNSEITEIKRNIANYVQQLSDAAKGADRINYYLRSMFPKSSFQVSVVKDNMYKLLRNGVVAKNLSEGEKSAISFAYFLVSLEDRNTNLSESIIFIDDPISSLDINNLHNVFALIRTKFGNGSCKQLFVTTHSIQFFNLIKDYTEQFEKRDSEYYFIERKLTDKTYASVLIPLPYELKKFKSEYVYLFSKLYEFNLNPTSDFELLYLIPNILRRFLEGFISFKKPDLGKKNQYEYLFEEIHEKSRVYKFVNEFSHNLLSERSFFIPDLSESKDIVALCLNAIKKIDEDHYESLTKVCNCK